MPTPFSHCLYIPSFEKILLIYLQFRLNIRQQHNLDHKYMKSQELMPLSAIVFGTAVPSPSLRSRSRHNISNLDVDVISRSEHNPGIPDIIIDTESEYDTEAQSQKIQDEKDPYSPFFSPLENRKQMGMLLHVQEPEEYHKKGFFHFWKG